MTAVTAEPTLSDVRHSVWKAKLSVVVGGVFGLLAAIIFLSVAVPHYRVTMLVGPAEHAPKADIKALLPDNPSFALQYLVSTMGSQDSSDFMRFENTLRGPAVAAELLKDAKIKDGMAHNGPFVFSPAAEIDSPQELSDLLQKEISIDPIGNTPLRRIGIDVSSREFGLYVLNKAYAQTDGLIRAEVLNQARNRAAYLQDMLGKVNNPDHRRALTALLMEQEHIQMIMGANEAYSAIIAEAPSVSVKPWWPRKSLILAGFVFAGMVLGFALGAARARR
ncbi:MAG: hypothetical protein JWO78_1733 [Micavibrio sp.]|nr:hypothetical protein [Micavibrio sp.]